MPLRKSGRIARGSRGPAKEAHASHGHHSRWVPKRDSPRYT